MDCGNTKSSTTIQDLNDDCLVYIFSILPIIDQIKIQRVCKRWRLLSQIALNKLKRFEVYNKEFWGIDEKLDEKSKVEINRDIFKNILKLYCRNITHIDFGLGCGNTKNLNIVPNRKVFRIVHRFCPNIRSFIVGDKCQKVSLRYIAEHFRNLTNFRHYKLDDRYHNELARLFSNNKNLRSLSLNYNRFPSSSFLRLNSESIEEIHLFSGNTSELDPMVFMNLNGIHTLTVEYFFNSCDELKEMLRVIGLHLQKLRKLKFDVDYTFSNITKNASSKVYNFIITLTDLEELHIVEQCLVNNHFIEMVCNNCKKLKTLKIAFSDEITDEGMSKIKLLPNLQNLDVKSARITGSFLMSKIPKLKKLAFEGCRLLQDEGIIIFLLNSQSIENIEITSCPDINGTDLINTIIRNFKNRKFEKCKIEIRAEVNEDSCVDVEILKISGEYYTRESEKKMLKLFT